MEILLNSMESDDAERIISELKKEFSLKVNDERDIGCGADWPFVPVIINGLIGVGAIFFLGKKIEENLEAWAKIGKRLKNIINKEPDVTSIFIDEEAAVALAINEIAQKVKINSLKLLSKSNLGGMRVDEVYYDGRDKNELSSMPFDFFILTFEVNEKAKFIFCIGSNGEIRYRDIFIGSEYDYSENWNSVNDKYLI